MTAETATIDYETPDGQLRTVPTGQTIRVQLTTPDGACRRAVLPGEPDHLARQVSTIARILQSFGLTADQVTAALRQLSADLARDVRQTTLLWHNEHSRPSFPRQEWRGPELRGAWTDELAEPPTRRMPIFGLRYPQAADECTGRDTYVEMPSTGKGDPFADLMSRIDDLTE